MDGKFNPNKKIGSAIMRIISTKSHGILDYLSVGLLFGVPRVLKWNRTLTNLLTGAALTTLVYSFFTRYEMGMVKSLPMEMHLGLDAMSGMALCASPLLLKPDNSTVTASLVGIGLFEIAAALTTETKSAE
jgi:hypothetical protein